MPMTILYTACVSLVINFNIILLEILDKKLPGFYLPN